MIICSLDALKVFEEKRNENKKGNSRGVKQAGYRRKRAGN